MQTGLQKTGSFFQQAFGITAPLAAAAAVAGVVKLGSVVVNAAADQNEALNVVDKTFGRTQDTVTRFAENAATSFGISETAALQAAGGFGAMFKSAGITGQGLADMSTKVVGLAGDLASFKNVAPEEALEKLRSGLAGEAEPLRTFGVFLSEATVKAEAYKLGIAATGAELTEAQKIQARYSVILKQTTDAHGDFAETLGESLPNQLRAMRAELTNLAADIGQSLLPIVLQVTKVLRATLGPTLKVVAENLDLVAIGFAAFAAFRWVPGLINATAVAFVKLQAAMGASLSAQIAASNAFALIGSTATGMVAALAAAPAVFHQIVQAIDPVEPEMVALNERMKEFGVVRGPAMEQAAQRLADKLAGDEAAMAQRAEIAASGILNLAGATAETKTKFREFQEGIHRFANLSVEALHDFRENAVKDIRGAAGAVDGIREKWDFTTQQAIRDIESMAKMARDMAKDFKSLDRDAVPEKFKQFLIEQGPAAVHAFVTGTERQKARFLAAWKQYEEGTRTAVNNMKDITSTGGRDVGRSLAEGLKATIAQYTGEVSRQAAFMVRDAIDAARAEAQAESPSKKMMELGVDLVEGLARGINTSNERVFREIRSLVGSIDNVLRDTGSKATLEYAEVIEAIGEQLEIAIAKMAKAVERDIGKTESRLANLTGRMSDLRSTISGGFGGFLDISGGFAEGAPPAAAFIQAQLAGAQQFASVLKALQSRHLSSSLLGQIAGTGPEAIPFAQQLLQLAPKDLAAVNKAYGDIAEIAQKTSRGLSEDYFGQRVQEVRSDLHELRESLRNIERAGADRVHITINGNVVGAGGLQELADVIRTEIVKTKNRNVTSGV